MPNLTPEQQAEQNKLYTKYIELLQKANGLNEQQAKLKADAAKAAGDLKTETERLDDILTEITNKSSYLFNSFRETTSELRNQNLILDAGKSVFSKLTSIAEDFNYQQRGISDLSERDLKRRSQNIAQSQVELKDLKTKLSLADGSYNRQAQLNTLLDLSTQEGVELNKEQQKLLDQLQREKNLLDAANNALEEGIPLLNEELKISKQIFKTREELNGIAGAAASIIEKYGAGLASFLEISEAKEEVGKFNKKLIDDALKSKAVLDEMAKIDQQRISVLNSSLSIQGEIASIQKQINDAIEAGNKKIELENEKLRIQESIQNNINEAVEINVQNAAKRVELQELNNRLINLGADAIEDRLTIEQQIANINREISENQNRQVQINLLNNGHRANIRQIDQDILDQAREADKLNDLELKKQQKKQDLLNNEKKITQDLLDLDKKEADVKASAVASVNTLSNKFKALGVFISESAGGIKKLFTDPITLLTTLVGLGFKANQQVVDLGKSFGLSAKATENIRQDVAAFARSTGDTFINTDRLLKAQSELSQEMGMQVKFSNEELATFARLTELTGLSAQEAGKLAKNAAAAGMSTEDYTKGIREGAFSAMQATKTHFSQKEIMQDISKLSAGITTKFQGNPKALAAAVVEAKKLGSSLEQIDKIGDSILNWESSIENELKAELMTGKQLNLERARAAALSGDQLTLTREIASQVGTSAEFNKMNVLAQKSLAEAFGLSRDEMADMLMKQEAVNTYGAAAAKLNKDQLEDMKRQGLSADEYLKKQEQQRSAQDKFKDAMVKLQDIIGNLVAGPVGQLLDALANMVGFVMKIFGNPIVKGFLNVISWIAEKLSDVASTTGGSLVLGLTAIALLLPKIGAGLSGIGRSILGLGKGIRNAFSGEGIKGFFSKVKSGFSGVKPPKSQFAGGSFSKGKELVAKKQAADAATANADKTSTTAKGGGDNAKGFAERMKNIAKGIKYFADVKVLLGAFNLIPASIGLVAFIPGALGAKIIQTIDGGKLKESLKGIAGGIKTFADTKVLLGSFAMILASAGLVAMIPGAIGARIIQIIDGKQVKQSLSGLAAGISELGSGKVVVGALTLPLISAGLTAMIPGVVGAKLIEQINGKKLKESLSGLAAGLSELGTGKTIIGALTLIPSSIGLIAMIPGVLGAKLIEQINGEKFKQALSGLASGISELGSSKILLGSLTLIPAAIGLIAMIPGVAGAKLIEQINGIKLKESLKGIASGVKSFADTKVLLGSVAMVVASAGLVALIPGALGAAVIGTVGPLAKKGLSALASGIKKFGDTEVMKGALGIALLGASLIPAAFALQMFAKIKWEDMAKAGVALIGLGVAGAVFGSLSEIMFIGALAIAALGAALIPFAIALRIMTPAIEKFGIAFKTALDGVADIVTAVGNAIKTGLEGVSLVIKAVGDSVVEIINAVNKADTGKIFAMGPALLSLAGGLAALGAGGVVKSATGFISGAVDSLGNLIGITDESDTGGPVSLLNNIAASAEKVVAASEGLKSLTSTLEKLNSIDTSNLTALAPALKSVGESMVSLGAGSILTGIGNILGGGIVEMLKGIGESGDGVEKTANAAKSLTSIDINSLDALSPTLKNVGDSMLSLSAASLLLEGSPPDILKNIATSGTGIQKSADALQAMANSLTQVASALNKVDVDKLSKVNNNKGGGGGFDFGSLLNPFNAVSNMVGMASSIFGGGTEETSPTPITTGTTTVAETTPGSIQSNVDLSPMITAIKEVKASIDKLYAKDQSIYIDGKKVGSTLTQGSYKVA